MKRDSARSTASGTARDGEAVRTGKPHVSPDKPAHTPGVTEGNSPGSYEKSAGHLPDGRSTARRSTGINPKAHDPILPGMPNLSPA